MKRFNKKQEKFRAIPTRNAPPRCDSLAQLMKTREV